MATVVRRAFLAHRKGITDLEVSALIDQAMRTFEAVNTRPNGDIVTVQITSGRESAKTWETFHPGAPFNWHDWQSSVVGCVDPYSSELQFHYFVVPTGHVGRGTVPIIKAAMAKGRSVFLLDGAKLSRAHQLVQLDENDWKNGWMLVSKE